MGPALRLSCRSELHVLPQFPVAQTIRSPDYDELSGPHRCLQSGPACYGLVGHPGISTPESLRGFELLRILPSVLPVTSLHETSCGFHRFEPVKWNGVATAPGNVTYPTRNFADRSFSMLINNIERAACSFHVRSCMSPCRWDYIFIGGSADVWRVVSEDSDRMIGLSC